MFADYSTLLRVMKTTDDNVHNLFRCGSRVYGCANEKSDEDFLAVLHHGKQDLLFRHQLNITVHTVQTFETAIKNHVILALECIFSPEQTRLKNGASFPFKLNRALLYERALATSTSDYEKSRHLLEEMQSTDPSSTDELLLFSKTKLYHSLRVLLFARQITTAGIIQNFGEANGIRKAIFENESMNWEDYRQRYEPLRNELLNSIY
jgi:hypothetical protein